VNSFFDRLPDFFEQHQILAWFRLTKAGVFVHEEAFEPLLAAYQEWTRRSSDGGDGKSIEKCRKRLFGDQEPTLFYALDGNRCLPGILLSQEQADPKTSRIPVYQATLQSTAEYLHPRDPYLLKLDVPKSRMSTHEGFLLEYPLKDKRYEVPEYALREFASVLRGNPQARRTYPELVKTLRGALCPLGEYLKNARGVNTNESQIVPRRFKGKPGISFVRSKGVTFVLENSKRVIGCYSVKGKALGRFIRTELGEKQAPEIRGFAPGSPKKHCIGKTWSQGISFHLELKALLFFLRQLPKASRNSKRLPTLYSAQDVIERFVGIFRNTKPADERSLLGKLRRRESFAKYRRVGNWIFVIHDKNTITSCVHLSEQLLRPESKDKQVKEL